MLALALWPFRRGSGASPCLRRSCSAPPLGGPLTVTRMSLVRGALCAERVGVHLRVHRHGEDCPAGGGHRCGSRWGEPPRTCVMRGSSRRRRGPSNVSPLRRVESPGPLVHPGAAFSWSSSVTPNALGGCARRWAARRLAAASRRRLALRLLRTLCDRRRAPRMSGAQCRSGPPPYLSRARSVVSERDRLQRGGRRPRGRRSRRVPGRPPASRRPGARRWRMTLIGLG